VRPPIAPTALALVSAVLLSLGLSALAQAPTPSRERVICALQRAKDEPLGQLVRAHLYASDSGAEVGTGKTSDQTGTLAFERLPVGRYDLWVEGSAVPGGEVARALFRGLDVTAGDSPQAIEIRVPPSCVVTGHLTLPDGKTPATGYTVAVQSGTVPQEGTDPASWAVAYACGALTCYAETRAAADGSFTLHGLAPGLHSLDVRRPGEREACTSIQDVEAKPDTPTDVGAVTVPIESWEYLWNRRDLTGWAEGDFYGRKEVRVEDGRIVISMGNDMTGITRQGDVPRVDYEVTLQAMRVAGDDFFCGLTFPVKEDYCSLILGGWGGSVAGLSSLDWADASENETTQWIQFTRQQWYRVRVRVTADRISAWLDEKRIIDVATADRRISIRIECEPSKPLGVCTWRTTGAVRDLRLRRIGAAQ
jgi:hypothetical protein